MKAFLNAPITQSIIAFLLASYIRLAGWTIRWQIIGQDDAAKVWNEVDGVVCCIWHGRLLYGASAWPTRQKPVKILVSQSRDGDVISKFANWLGVQSIRGSSSNDKKSKDKGALKAFRAMVDQIQSGHSMAITPDGPRGPRMRAATGTVRLAKVAKAPIIPFTWSSTNAVQFKSWDCMMLPVPFGRGVIIFGEPILMPERASADELQAIQDQMEAELNAITRRADEMCGREPVEPA